MEGLFGWIGEIFSWIGSFIPSWEQIDRNEKAIKHKGWRKRRSVVLEPGVRWYWPAFSQIEGPFKVVWQPLTTSTINVMDKDEKPVGARGFAVYRISDVERYAVDNEDAPSQLDDLLCAAIREVVTSKTVAEIQANGRNTTDNALLREVKDLTEDLGVEIKLVRLTTFTTTRVLSVLGDEAPQVVDEEPSEEE